MKRSWRGSPSLPKKELKTVLETDAQKLVSIPDVTGVGTGELPDKTPCIIVFVSRASHRVRTGVPSTLHGHPVVIEVSG